MVRFGFLRRFVDFMDCRLVQGDTLMKGESKFISLFVLFVGWSRARKEESADSMYSPGQDIVRSVAGPMACSITTIERYMEVLPEAKPWEVDQHVAPVAWRRELASPGAKRLRIGFLVDDGVVKVQPPIARAIREVIEALKAAGHDGMITDNNLSNVHSRPSTNNHSI